MSIDRNLRFGLGIFLLLCSLGVAVSQTTTATLEGVVRDAAGDPVDAGDFEVT